MATGFDSKSGHHQVMTQEPKTYTETESKLEISSFYIKNVYKYTSKEQFPKTT
jgi:hypothetical protein